MKKRFTQLERMHIESIVSNIPYDLAELIRSQKKSYTQSFFEFLFKKGESWQPVPYTEDEYQLMLIGAALAYNNQQLLGRALPKDDERCVELNKFLIKMGIAIQWHPHHGMQIVEIEPQRLMELGRDLIEYKP